MRTKSEFSIGARWCIRLLWILLLSLRPVQWAHADWLMHRWESEHRIRRGVRIQVAPQFFTTNSNSDQTGGVSVPLGLAGLQRFGTDATVHLALDPRFGVYGRLNWQLTRLDSASRSGLSFGLGDQSLGATWLLWETGSGWGLSLQGQWDFPAYSNSAADASFTPYLGDGSFDFTGGLFLTAPFYRFRGSILEGTLGIIAGAAGTYRTAGYSTMIPWSALVRFEPARVGPRLELGATGLVSIRTDVAIATHTTAPQAAGSGGSYVVNAINPSTLQGLIRAGYQVSPEWGVSGYLQWPMLGWSAPVALVMGVGFHFGFGTASSPSPAHQAPAEYGRSNRGALSYTLSAKVLQTNDRFHVIKIDRGSQDGVEVSQIFDIFRGKQDGGLGDAVARARVTSVRSDEAALEIEEYFQEGAIDSGAVAQRLSTPSR